jgi:uncharacterized metal-binding protein YceD (DUF177 family)
MTIMTTLPEPEFSVPLAVDKIPAAGLTQTLDADAPARKRLAARFDLIDLPRLHADLTVQSARAGRAIQVKGRVSAEVVQKCGVTGEPVPDRVENDIDVLYTSEDDEESPQTFIDPTAVEIEPIEGGVIDLGELVAQHFGIALNPYPRKPGAVFESDAKEGQEVARNSPLAKIAELTKKLKDKSEG